MHGNPFQPWKNSYLSFNLAHFSMTEEGRVLKGKLETLKSLVIQRATGHYEVSDVEYKSLREQLLEQPLLKDKLPYFIRDCRDLSSFWDFIKPLFPTYAERRTYLRKEFEPAIVFLEGWLATPIGDTGSRVLSVVDSNHVRTYWRKTLERLPSDPEGAITSAKSLLESVCKHVLDKKGIKYAETEDLPGLYQMTASALGISPSRQTDDTTKKILGSCVTIVNGVANLRNKLSDAHGKGESSVPASGPQAELAVRVAGAASSFLISSFEEQ